MKNSTFVSFVVLLLLVSSCSSIKSGCENHETTQLTRKDIHPIIGASDSLQTFDIEINFMGKSITGMLLVKQQATDTVRMVVNSYFGMSMMDFEFSPHSSTMHYMLEAMNKPLFVNMFMNDFQLLFGLNIPERFFAQRSVCKNSETLISVEMPKGKYLYRMAASGLLTEIKAPGVRIKSISEPNLRTITLKHTGIFAPNIIIRENLSK